MIPQLSAKSRTMAGLVCCLMLLLLTMQVDSSTSPGTGGKPKVSCLLLEFFSDSLQRCVPCHLCGPIVEDGAIRNVCRSKHPDPIEHHGGMFLWCDDPKAPLPECPPLPAHITVLNHSAGCLEDGRKFVPDCKYVVGCGGNKRLTIQCTRNLTWKETKELEECKVLPTTKAPISEEDDGDLVIVVLGSTIPVMIIAITIVAIVGTCAYKRMREPQISKPSASSSGSSSSSESSSEAGANSPLLNKKPEESPEINELHKYKRGSLGKGANDIVSGRNGDDAEVVREVPFRVSANSSRVENTLQTRQAKPEQDKVRVHLALQNKDQEAEKVTERVPQQPELRTVPEHERKSSFDALHALLQSRSKLFEFTKMFDQEYTFGQITWHDVAGRFAEWDRETVKSSEYLLRPQASCSPADGCMYQVMLSAHRKGKGLLDLLHCLQSFEFRNDVAERQLEQFWKEWKLKHRSHTEEIC